MSRCGAPCSEHAVHDHVQHTLPALTSHARNRHELREHHPYRDHVPLATSHQRQILAVDDDPLIHKILTIACRRFVRHLQLRTAGSVHEAVELSRRFRYRFDLVVLDHELEGVQGWQLLDYVRPWLPKTAKSLVYSSQVDAHARTAYKQREVQDILAKPLSVMAVGFAIGERWAFECGGRRKTGMLQEPRGQKQHWQQRQCRQQRQCWQQCQCLAGCGPAI